MHRLIVDFLLDVLAGLVIEVVARFLDYLQLIPLA
jgi:hypothetical protein